jgi:Flp pilus assembly protein TadD
MIGGCLLIFILFITLFVGAAGYGIYHAVRIANEGSAGEQAKDESLRADVVASTADRDKDRVAAFSAEDSGVSPEELATLQTLFDKVYEHREKTLRANRADLEQVFDFDAFQNRLYAWPENQSLNYFQRLGVTEQFRDQRVLDSLNDKFTIVHVAKRPDSQSAIVSGYVGLESGMHVEQRWLIVAHGSSWRVADSEMCDWGCWRTQLHARQMKAAEGSPTAWNQFNAAADRVDQASTLIQAGNADQGLAQLEAINYAGLDSRLQDEMRMRILQATMYVGDPQKRLLLAQQFQHPEQWPGAAYAQAHAHAALGNHQEAIEAGRKFMAQVGPTVGINQLLLPCYEQLGDKEGQAAAYRHLLRVRPADASSLAGLAKVSGDNAAEVVERLRKLPDPPPTASQVVLYLDVDEHKPAIDALLEFLQSTAPDSLSLLETKAHLASLEEDHETAAGLYLEAWKKHRHDESASRHCANFFSAMIAADQVDAAFDQAPDPQAAIQFLANDYFFYGDYGVQEKQFRSALEKYRAQHGDDAHVVAYQGKLLVQERQYAQAEQQLRAALEKLSPTEAAEPGDEEEGVSRGDLLSQLATALLMQDRVEEAYETAAVEVPNAAWTLFSQLDLTRAPHREHARKLVALERARQPAELWSGVMEATLLDAENKPAEAWAALPKAVPENDYFLAWPVRNLAASLLASGAVPLAQYSAIAPRDVFFDLLIQRLAEEKQWDRVAELVRLEEDLGGHTYRVSAWQAELFYQRGHYQLLLTSVKHQSFELLGKYRDSYQRHGNPIDRMLRSQIHLQRYDDALALAKKAKRQPGGPVTWPAWIHLSQGDVEQAIAALEGQSDRSHYQFYYDPEFGPLARTEAALPLRQQAPPDLPTAMFWRRAELLLRQEVTWDDVQLTALARQALGADASATQLQGLQQQPPGTKVWRITHGSESFLVFAGRRSSQPADDHRQTPHDERLASAWQTYQGWIIMIPGGEASDFKLPAAAYPLAAALAGEHCLAVRIGEQARMFAFDEALRKTLRAADAAKQLQRGGEVVSGWLLPDQIDSQDQQQVRGRQWLSLARRLAEQPPPENARVCARLQACGCREDVWLRVERLVGKPSRHGTFVVTPEQPSLLIREIKLGEPYLVSVHSLHDFEYTQDGATVRGRSDASTE